MTFIRGRITTALLATGIALALPSAPPRAQGPKPMTLVDLAELSRLNVPQLSPDGRTLLYFLSHADWSLDRPVYHLWRQNIGGGAPVQLTFSDGGDVPVPGSLRWSPDGKTILFLRAGQFYLLSAEGGEPRALTHHATGIGLSGAPQWTPDGSAVLFLASDPRTAEDAKRAIGLKDDVYAFDEDYKQRHLWKVNVASGAETQITSGDYTVLDYRLSIDGTRIAMHRAPSPLNQDQWRGEVWVMDANGDHALQLTHNVIEEYGAELSPDNSQILFQANANAKQEWLYNANLFVVPAAGGTPRLLVPDLKYEVDQATWSRDGKSILASLNMGVHSEIFRIDVPSGAMHQLTDGQHYITTAGGGWQVVPSANTMVMQLDEPTRFGDVWTMPIDGSAAPTRITGVFDNFTRDFAVPRQEKVEWTSKDGTTIEGLLFYPIGYQPGTRYPLVVQMHGGPFESDKFGAGAGLIQSYFPVLTAKGYAVLRPNYRGSAGYGNAFYRGVVGHYFQDMPYDILNGVDALIQRGIVNPDQMVLMGWSAGGHLANKLITMTDRFKASSSGASLAQWISLYAQTDSRVNRNVLFGGTPWQKNAPTDLYWAESPLKDVANIKTPALFFSSDRDERIGMWQSVEMYRALNSHGVPTHLYIAPREGHQWGELRHLLFKANTELEWFEKYARGKTYTWEKTPQ